MANPPLYRACDRAVSEYAMLRDGDAVLIGASGGKDSTALAGYLSSLLKRRGGPGFRLEALHVRTEFESRAEASVPGEKLGADSFRRIGDLFSAWGIPLHVADVSVLDRLKPGRKMSCWWCSTQRRTELNNFALKHGFNKIALGHHLDDILETLLMNAFGKGELSTMPPVLHYEKYPVCVIRPLCFCDTEMIIRHTKAGGYSSSVCTCAYQDNSFRKEARKKLATLTCGSYREKLMLFESLRNIKNGYLP